MGMYKVIERASLSSKIHKVVREDEKGNKKTVHTDFAEEGDMLEWDEKNGPPPLWLEVPGRDVVKSDMGILKMKSEPVPKTMADANKQIDLGGDPAQLASTSKVVRDKLDARAITYFKGASLEVLQGLLQEAEHAKAD